MFVLGKLKSDFGGFGWKGADSLKIMEHFILPKLHIWSEFSQRCDNQNYADMLVKFWSARGLFHNETRLLVFPINYRIRLQVTRANNLIMKWAPGIVWAYMVLINGQSSSKTVRQATLQTCHWISSDTRTLIV